MDDDESEDLETLDALELEEIRRTPRGTRRRARLIAMRAACKAYEAGDLKLCDQILDFCRIVLSPQTPRDERGRFIWMPSTAVH